MSEFQLREGMFCRDANGEKVGPIRRRYGKWEHMKAIGLFFDNGDSISGIDADLISEWQDTPAADEWSEWMTEREVREYLHGFCVDRDHQMRCVNGNYTFSVPVSRKAVKREKIRLFWTAGSGADTYVRHSHTHRISFDLVNGIPDCASIKMDEL